MTALYFITGSSGSGKTTLLKRVVDSVYPELAARYFDEIGVPSPEEMNDKLGGLAAWQVQATKQWMSEIASHSNSGLVVFEGQVRPNVVLNAAKEVDIAPVHITLLDCLHEERRRRLIECRAQPELDQLDMYMWAAYLRGQAGALGIEVIDTTSHTESEAVLKLAGSIARFARENNIELKNIK